MTPTDLDLLREYAEKNSEPAFAALVQRHLNLVYSAALRQVRSPQLAEEVAQSVFADLARNAAKLKPGTILTAWLYEVARRTAIDVIRREARRQLREQIATEMNAANASASDWTHIEPLLDDAMHALDGTDRAAILLRYFENKSLREVGATLGTSDDAAQKRVTRAVERLREYFAKHGVTTGAAALAAVVSTNAVQAAPAGLAVTISAAVALGGAAITTAAISTHTTMNLISFKSATLMATAALAAGTGTYLVQQHDASLLRAENQNLVAAQKKLGDERDAAVSKSVAARDDLANLRQNLDELLRLRSEVGTLRRQATELEKLRETNRQLQAALSKPGRPAQPAQTDPDLEPQQQVAIARLNDAKLLVLGLLMYAEDNQNQLPGELNSITNHLTDSSPQLTGTNQFELVLQGKFTSVTNPASTIAVREKDAWFRDGKMVKAYGFADGHAELKTEPAEGFAAWEAQHIMPPP